MARTKAPATRREPSDLHSQSNGRIHHNGYIQEKVEDVKSAIAATAPGQAVAEMAKEPGVVEMAVSVAGIYGAFLSWGFLQERITTTSYGSAGERFKYPVFLNTVQSVLAALIGLLYLSLTTKHPHKPGRPLPVFPSRRIVAPLFLAALTCALASPFGYASLAHIDYVTFLLAKSCKLLPVIVLHTTVFRRRYPLYKYGVVCLVTLGVAVFTLHHPGNAAKRSRKPGDGSGSTAWGLTLLGINLLLDGLMNSTQDYVFQAFRPFTGAQMMVAMNLLGSALNAAYLVAAPSIASSALGRYLNMAPGAGDELSRAWDFVTRYPAVGWDVVAFGFCGAVGQVFIFYVVGNFSSLVLVTVTVTRKMMTMMLSVVWFGHTLSPMQYLGVALVFGGIGAEAVVGKREKDRKARVQAEAGGKKKS